MVTMTLDVFLIAIIGPAVLSALCTWYYLTK